MHYTGYVNSGPPQRELNLRKAIPIYKSSSQELVSLQWFLVWSPDQQHQHHLGTYRRNCVARQAFL